jgi:hypothetical protein
MIDTLRFTLSEYSILPENNLVIIPPGKRNGKAMKSYTFYLDKDSGYKISGHKVFYIDSDGKFRFEIKLIGSQMRCFITLSIPKYFNDSNFYPVSIDEFELIINEINLRLKTEIGVICDNIWESKLSRIDIFKNVKLEFPFIEYTKILAGLNLPRAKKRHINYETFYLQFWEYSLIIYDKIYEMISKNQNIVGLSNEYYARIEYRLNSKRIIERETNVKVLADIDFSELESCLNDFLDERIFYREPTDIKRDNIIDYARESIRKGDRFWKSNLKKAMWTTFVENIDCFITLLKEELKKKGFTEMQINRQLRQLYNDFVDDSILVTNTSKTAKSPFELYKELKTAALS